VSDILFSIIVLGIFETVSYVADNNLIHSHQQSHFTTIRRVGFNNGMLNSSVQQRLKLFESKPSYAGFLKLPSHMRNIKDSKHFKRALKII
jgi:hypothetical protein